MLTCFKLKCYINLTDWNTNTSERYITFDVCKDSMKNHYMHKHIAHSTQYTIAAITFAERIYIQAKSIKLFIFRWFFRSLSTAHTRIHFGLFIYRMTVAMHVCTETHRKRPHQINWVLCFVDIFSNNLHYSRALLQIVIVRWTLLSNQTDGPLHRWRCCCCFCCCNSSMVHCMVRQANVCARIGFASGSIRSSFNL